MPSKDVLYALLYLAVSLGLAGCGKGSDGLALVEGQVILGDTPLATGPKIRGTVVLYPDKSKGNESLEIPRGTIDSEGKFKVMTGTKPGAAPGWYTVTVDAAKVIDPKNPYHTASGFLVPPRYIDKDESPLAFQVAEKSAPGAYDLKLDEK